MLLLLLHLRLHLGLNFGLNLGLPVGLYLGFVTLLGLDLLQLVPNSRGRWVAPGRQDAHGLCLVVHQRRGGRLEG